MATPTPLITRADFNGYIELSANMADAKINNRILEAQTFDLRNLMGDAFYYSFIALQPDPGELTNGGNYTINDIEYTFYGIKPVLVYYTTARLLKALDLHFTPNGVMQKRNDFSDHLDPKDLAWRVNQYKNEGLGYWNMCSTYLDNNKTLYPLWKPDCACDSPGSSPAPKIASLGGEDNSTYGYSRGYIRSF